MQIRCTSCGKTLQVDDKFAGKKVKCACNAVLQVPAGAVASAAAQPVRSAAGAPVARQPAQPAPSAFGIDHKEMSSLFDELTAGDMIVKGKSTDAPKGKKKVDPLAAYGGSSIPSTSSSKSPGRAAPSGNLNLASRGQRFATNFLDNFFIGICSGALGFGVGIALVAGGNASEENIQKYSLFAQIFSYAMAFLYFVVMEAAFGRTMGKLAAGTRVVSEDGSDASIGQIIGRTLCRMIPFDPLSFLSGDKPTGWHDTISKTRVISIR